MRRWTTALAMLAMVITMGCEQSPTAAPKAAADDLPADEPAGSPPVAPGGGSGPAPAAPGGSGGGSGPAPAPDPQPPPGAPSTQGPMTFPTASVSYSGKVGDAFSQQLPAATGGKAPVEYSLISNGVIGGLRFDESTRTLAGTPTSHGSERMLLFAVDSGEGVYQSAAQMWVRVSIESNLPKTITVTATLRYSSIEEVTLSGLLSGLPGYKATYRVAWSYNPPGNAERLGRQAMSAWHPIRLHATATGCSLSRRVYVLWPTASASVSLPCAELLPVPPCRQLPCPPLPTPRYRYYLSASQAAAVFKTLDGRTKTWTCRLSSTYTCLERT